MISWLKEGPTTTTPMPSGGPNNFCPINPTNTCLFTGTKVEKRSTTGILTQHVIVVHVNVH